MKIEPFELERFQSVWEKRVTYNLSESGVHPLSLYEILTEQEIADLIQLNLGYNQTNGSPELRSAIARIYPKASEKNVLITNGSAEANLLAILTLLEPGEEILYMIPNYLQIWGMAHALGIIVKPLYLKEELGWQIDVEELKNLISSKTKMIAICNPNNPTGAVMELSIMNEITSIAEKNGAYILSDEVYRGGELSGRECPSFWGKTEKVIVNGGLSKAYGLPGLRIGWTIGPSEYISQAWATHDYTSIAVSLISDKIAEIVMQPERRQKILSRSRKILVENLNLLQQWLENNGNLFSFIPPQTGAIAFLKYTMDIDSSKIVNRLREEKDVLLVAGKWFGIEGYLRIGFGGQKELLIKALNRMNDFFSQYW